MARRTTKNTTAPQFVWAILMLLTVGIVVIGTSYVIIVLILHYGFGLSWLIAGIAGVPIDGLLWGILDLFAGLRERSKARFRNCRDSGLCPKCGHILRGDLDAGCPECGWGREECQ